MSSKTGFCTITYRFRLYCENMQLLRETKVMYNRVLKYYYDVIRQETAIWEVPKLQMMRELELLTVGSRGESSDDTKYPFPFEKVPLYFRRAAINDAIRLHRSFRTGEEGGAKSTATFDAAPIYYKGMYKEFTSTSINLKLYNGAKWVWQLCEIDTCGRTMPTAEKIQSPIIVLDKDCAMLHVPVKEEVEDARSAKERLANNEKICAVYFPNSDTLATMVLLEADSTFIKSKFIGGGKELSHRKQILLDRIEKNRQSMGYGKEKWNEWEEKNGPVPREENKAIKEKIHHITDDVAHKVSREIIEFCKENEVSIIVVPNYKQQLDFSKIGYVSSTRYDWIGRRIISYVKYKSFAEGIVTVTASTKNIAACCNKCGAVVKKYNKNHKPGVTFYGGKNFICPNGHQGNSYFNSAMNVAKNFLQATKNY